MNFAVMGLAFTYPYYIILGCGIFFILNILDILTSKAIFAHGGTEKNPLMRWLMQVMGVNPALILSKVFGTMLTIAAAGYLDSHLDTAVVALLIVGYSWVVNRNWREWKRLQKLEADKTVMAWSDS